MEESRMIEDILLCVLVLAWNGFLVYKMRKDKG